MNRRNFLQSILAAGVAPAFVGAKVLMPIREIYAPTISKIILPNGYLVITNLGDKVTWVGGDVSLHPGQTIEIPTRIAEGIDGPVIHEGAHYGGNPLLMNFRRFNRS